MTKRLFLVTLIIFAPLLSRAADTAPVALPTPASEQTETQAQRDARMAWWREAKFGMFIHWGVYSVPAGFYHGQPVGDIIFTPAGKRTRTARSDSDTVAPSPSSPCPPAPHA